MKKTALFRTLSAPVFALAAVFAASLCASAQTGTQTGVPPVFVQVPFASLEAGGTTCSGAIDVDGTNYGDGCPATQVAITAPYSTAVDKWGNVYYAATPSAGIVQVIYAGAVIVNGVSNPATALIEAANSAVGTPVAGDVYTVAGGLSGAPSSCTNGATPSGNGSGCPGTGSYLKKAYGIAVDADGNIFILDESESDAYVLLANSTDLAAQLVSLEDSGATLTVGSIYLVAGKGGGYADGVLATSGKIHESYGIAVDANENLYIADYENDAVRMINGPNTTSGGVGPGYIHTIAGDCTSSGCTALSGTAASNTAAIGAAFVDPAGIAVDAYGNVYVGDNADAVSATASVRVIYAGGSNNPVANLISLETGVSTPTAGYVYTIAGYANGGSTSVGNGSLATASNVGFDRITGLTLDSNGNLYIVDYNGADDMSVAELNASNGYLYYIAGGSVASSLGSGDYCNGGSNGPAMTDAYGDGCPATQASAHHAEGNPSFDSQGNLYFADNDDGLIRKLTFSSFPATSVGTAAATQSIAFSLLTGSSSEAASNVAATVVTQGTASNEFVNPGGSADTCTGSTTLTGFPDNAGTQADSTCVVPVTFTPAKAGLRAGAVQIAATVNSAAMTSTAFLNGTGLGAALAIDPSASSAIGSGTAPQGVATDAAGNTYIAWQNGTLSSTPAGPLATAITGATVNPHQIAIDGAGDVYVADTGNNRIAELASGATSFTTAVSAFGGSNLSSPQGVAVDGSGNLYIADTGNARVLFVPVSGQSRVLGSGFETPVAVAVDAGGNVYVADTGIDSIVKITASGTQTTLAGSVAPASLAVDAAGDVVYTDTALLEVVEIPASGANSVIASGLTTPAGVALDANGGVYLADTSQTGVLYYPRNASAQTYDASSDPLNATVTSIGNVAYSGTLTSTDSTDFELTDASSNGCPGTASLALAVGQNCGYTALFVPSATGTLTDTVTFTGNSVNGNPTLTLTGTNTVAKVDTTTTIGDLSPASPVYGGSVQLTVTVAPQSGSNTPAGTITYTVDGGTASAAETLTGGAYAFTLTGLSAAQHTVTASYTPGTSANFNPSSTATTFTFTVAPLAITASATSVSAVYGTAIPAITGSLTGVLAADTANVAASCSSAATAGSKVGSYPITCALTGSAAGNYTVTTTGSPTVTITPATVTLAIANATKTYGAANPTFSGTFTGVLAADAANVSANYSTIATASSAVGSYPITATALTGSAAGNYTLGTVTQGSLAVTPLAITATANSVTAAYGQAIPAITGSLTGVLAADTANVTPVFSTTATSASPVGSYPITVALTGSAAGNYTVTLTGSPTVSIKASAVAVAVNNATRAYGAANPAFSGTLTGVLPADAANVTAVYSTTATATSSVGSYPITATALAGSAAADYALGAVTPGTLTVTQAGTTITLATSNPSIGSGDSVTFTATVASATSGTPSGSVVFSASGSTICTITLSGGVAPCTTSSLPVGALSVTAAYAGSTDFTASTSSPVSETVTVPVVSGTTSSSSVNVSSGSTATVTVNIAAQGGYTGTATYSCALLPVDMTCSFSPATSTFTSSTTTASTTLTISTGGSSSATSSSSSAISRTGAQASAQRHGSGLASGAVPLAALAGIFAGLLALGKARKRLSRYLALMALLLAGIAGVGSLTGCAGGSSSAGHTPAGTYNIEVQVTAGTVQSIPLTVVVQ